MDAFVVHFAKRLMQPPLENSFLYCVLLKYFLIISVEKLQKYEFCCIFYLIKIINLPKMTQFFGRSVALSRPQSLLPFLFLCLCSDQFMTILSLKNYFTVPLERLEECHSVL